MQITRTHSAKGSDRRTSKASWPMLPSEIKVDTVGTIRKRQITFGNDHWGDHGHKQIARQTGTWTHIDTHKHTDAQAHAPQTPATKHTEALQVQNRVSTSW